MPDTDDAKAEAAAEKAYAAATETVSEPKAEDETASTAAVKAAAIEIPPLAAAPKAASSEPVAKPPRAKVRTKPRPAKVVPAAKTPKFQTKEPVMIKNAKIADGLSTMMNDAQAKAQEAYEKSTAFFGDYAEFAKGNVEAVVESGKILAEGLQDMGTNLIAESRSAFEAVSADIKGMAAAKSPTDLLQAQSDLVRKNFDTAVAYGSKNTEAVLKLASEILAPISGRVSVAVEKVRQSAI